MSRETEAKHRREAVLDGTRHAGHYCTTCGKVCYLSRKAAKKVLKKKFHGEKMIAYQCGEYWHLGHEPYGIHRGFQRRADVRPAESYKYRIEK